MDNDLICILKYLDGGKLDQEFVQMLKNMVCFAVSDDEGTHQWSFKVNMLYGNVVPKLGPPNKRVRNYCMKVDESKICFSDQPLLDDFSNKSWNLNNILFFIKL